MARGGAAARIRHVAPRSFWGAVVAACVRCRWPRTLAHGRAVGVAILLIVLVGMGTESILGLLLVGSIMLIEFGGADVA